MPRNWSERIITFRWAVVGVVALVTVVAGILATRVRFDNSIEMWFLENDPELTSYNQFAERFGGDEFVVIGVEADDVFSRPALESVERLTRMAAAKPHVIAVRSLTSVAFPGGLAGLPPGDAPLRAARERILGSAVERGWLVSPDVKTTAVLVAMDRKGNTVEGKNVIVGALREGVAAERGRAPGIRFFMAGTPVLDEAFFRYNNRDLARLLSADHNLARVSARIRLDQTTEVVHAFDRIAAKIAADVDRPGLSVTMTGYLRLMGKMEHYLISSQVQSFTLAFAVITLLLVILLGSWQLGLLAMIPNLLPVAMGLGTMALAGIGLSPGTIMIGAIALGLVVDDTVHFLVSLRRELVRDPDLDAAITATLRTCGRPIILTSVILMAGFAVMMVGSFNPSIQFGAISALVIGYALLADLLLLPAALRVMRPKVPHKFRAAPEVIE